MTKNTKIVSGAIFGLAAAIFGAVKLSSHTPVKYILQGNNQGYSNPNNLQPGDTLVLQGNFTYLSFGKVNGDKDAPITIIGDGAKLRNGIEFHDCNYFHLTAASTDDFQINSHNSNPGNIAINIEGKSGHFEIDHMQIDSSQYICMFKTDPIAHATDSSYWASLNMDWLYLHDIKVNYIKQDGIYAGNTDQSGKTPVTMNGKTYYTLPASVSNIHLQNIYATNIQRTLWQISRSSGTNIIDNVHGENMGFEYSLTNWEGSLHQGAFGALGGNNSGFFEIKNCTSKNSFLNSLYSFLANGTLLIHDNNFDSATVTYCAVNGKHSYNTQQLAAVQLSTSKNLILKVYNNKIGWSNNHVGLVTYGTGAAIGSYICNNTMTGSIQDNSGLNLKDNCSSIPVDTTTHYRDTTYKIFFDTVQHFSIRGIKKYDSSFLHRDSTINDSIRYAGRTIARTIKRQSTWTLHLVKDSTYDSVKVCFKCGSKDTTISVKQ